MGKLRNNLEKQLNTKHKEDAEDCIKIYDKLKELSNGHVWNSDWSALVSIEFSESFAKDTSKTKRYFPNKLGKIFLKCI